MTIFSERQGLKQSENLDPNTMPVELRNRLWNITKDYIDKEFHGQLNRDIAIKCIWDEFFKNDIDNLKSWDSYR